jgi:transposase-like protein
MYKQNFRNQAVKEVKNGSTAFSVAKKFDISPGTLSRWVDTYDEKMCEITRDEKVPTVPTAPAVQRPTGIQLKSIKVVISGAAVTLGRNDVLKLLSLFDEFEKE